MTQSRALTARRQLHTYLGLVPELCGSGLRNVYNNVVLSKTVSNFEIGTLKTTFSKKIGEIEAQNFVQDY